MDCFPQFSKVIGRKERTKTLVNFHSPYLIPYLSSIIAFLFTEGGVCIGRLRTHISVIGLNISCQKPLISTGVGRGFIIPVPSEHIFHTIH